jgi:N-acetylglutamate synthase-like GNAT family acetyltransferase
MTVNVNIMPITAFNPGLITLRSEAINEGYHFLTRLIDEWNSGSNRFNRPGERFLGAFLDDNLIGVCGLNRDPFTRKYGIGRLRHLYVTPSTRRRGIGSALIRQLIDDSTVFEIVRLRTDTKEAAAFYLRQGFVAVDEDSATHAKKLRRK